MMTRPSSLLAAFLGLLALNAAPVHAASHVSATLDPPTFPVNESTQLTVTVAGDEDAVPLIPRVPGLVINPVGQSTSIRQLNGAVSAIFSRTYRVTATHEGTFTIPPIPIGSLATSTLVLHVTAPETTQQARPGSTLPSPGHATTAGDVAAAVHAAMPFLKVILPKTRLYVGELLPIQIKAYFRDGISARLDGPPAAAGDAFTVSGLEKRPVQTQEEVAGIGYTVLTWTSVLGALKSGEYPVGLELPLTVNVQLPGSDTDLANRLRALFGTASPGAFMDDSDFGSLFGKVIQKSVTLKPDPLQVTVLPLPAEGRPADFSGAVGQFQAATEVAPAAGAVGDPLTFKLTVTGKGNLSRVSSQGLHETAQWRVYRPEAKVTAVDDSGLQGLKTFSQPVVPLQTGELTLPGLTFSYFDPEAGRYVTRATEPIRITVKPGVASTQVAPTLQAANARTAADTSSGDALAGDVSVTGRFAASLEPLVWRSWFNDAAIAPLVLMLATLLVLRRYRQRSNDPALMLHAARLAAVKINLEAMSAALHREDAAAFFSSARHALQERLADLWQVPAESVDQALVAQQLPGEHGAAVQAILAMAEKATYAGESPGAAVLQEWQRRVFEEMDRLEAIT